MSKDIISCTYNAVLKHFVRIMKVSYQKLVNVRIRLVYLIPSFHLQKNSCIVHRIATLISISILHSSVQLLTNVSFVVHYSKF